MIEAINRKNATQETLDQWIDVEFSWGDADCAKMVVSHLRRFGHNPGIAKARSWKSALTAKAAMKRFGYANLIECMDGMLHDRINGAEALVGDVAAIEADNPLGCLCICTGPNQWLSLHESTSGFTIIQITEFKAAWRIKWQKH